MEGRLEKPTNTNSKLYFYVFANVCDNVMFEHKLSRS